MTDHLRERFDSIDLTAIERLIKDRDPESLHLEFKRFGQESDDKSNFAKAVSGFANSDGGIVIWGIATKKCNGEDVASQAMPSVDASDHLRSFNQWKDDAANPSVEGVENKLIETLESGAFICTYVPASDGGPHMAKLGVNQYYRRSGGRFLSMEHYELADMFGRRPIPRLVPSIRLEQIRMTNDWHEVDIVFCILNKGRGAAYIPSLQIQSDPDIIGPFHHLGKNGSLALPLVQSGQGYPGRIFGCSNSICIPPGVAIDAAAYGVFVNSKSGMVNALQREQPEYGAISKCRFNILANAEGAVPSVADIYITQGELVCFARSRLRGGH